MNTRSTVALRSGNRMPVMGLGTWQLTNDTAGTIVRAFDLGYSLIDTASDYGTQAGIGEAMRRRGLSRDSLYVVVKVEETDQVIAAARRYLDEIGVEYADLLLLHRPPKVGVGEELWKGLVAAKAKGLARDIGVSNYSVEELRELIGRTGEIPAVNQIEWSPFGHSEAMRRFCQQNEIVIQAYSPLTRGARLDDRNLSGLAERYGRTPAQLIIRWNLQRGTVPVPKANQFGHLKEDLDVFGFEIGADDMAALDALNEHYSALGSLPYV